MMSAKVAGIVSRWQLYHQVGRCIYATSSATSCIYVGLVPRDSSAPGSHTTRCQNSRLQAGWSSPAMVKKSSVPSIIAQINQCMCSHPW
jgi:hypothetical protein